MDRLDSDALHEATTTGPAQAWPSGSPPSAHEAGQVDLPGYRDFVLIARSKASEVYRAHQEGVGRPVAVKVLLLDDAETVARFQRELDITVQLGRQHPHIVTVIDTAVTRDGQPCIVMELYDNGSLHDQLMAHGPLPDTDVLTAGVAVADAVAFAHRHGVLHRDVKPQNVLVLPTSYVLADFGIARRLDAAHTSSVGWFSFRHAAPQVLDGEPPSVADDIWSLGSTLYTLLDGRSPFAADDAEEDSALAYMRRVRTSRPRPLHRPGVPAELVAIIERCLRYEPASRFPDVDTLLRLLNDVAAQRAPWVSRRDEQVVQHAASPGQRPGGVTTVVAAPHAGRDRAVARAAARAVVRAPVAAARSLEVADAPEPEVRQPDALAGSALAHLPGGGAGPVDAGEQPTGRGPAGADIATVTPDAPAAKRRPVRVMALGVLGVLIAGLLAAGGAVLVDRAQSKPGADGTGEFVAPPGPALSPPVGGQSSAAVPPPGDPRIAPKITQVRLNGSNAVVRWQDPTAGDATFVVVRVVASKSQAVGTALPGSTQFLVAGLDPAEPPYCFLVIAVRGEQRAVSPTRCADAT